MRHRKGPSLSPPSGLSRIEVLVALFLIGNALALLGCATRRSHEVGARTMESNNLKQIGLAVHDHHDIIKTLPYNGTAEIYEAAGRKSGGPADVGLAGSGSWCYQILPYIEQQPLWKQATGTGSGPDQVVLTLHSPGRSRPGIASAGFKGAQTDYQLNPYINRPDLLVVTGDSTACNQEDKKVKLMEIKDGTSNVILAGQAFFKISDYTNQDGTNPYFSSIFRGGAQCTCRVGVGPNEFRRDNDVSPTSGWGGPFPQGGLFVMADATVRLFPYSINLQPFLDADDGMRVTLPD